MKINPINSTFLYLKGINRKVQNNQRYTDEPENIQNTGIVNFKSTSNLSVIKTISKRVDLKDLPEQNKVISNIKDKMNQLYINAIEKCEDDLGNGIHTIDSIKTKELSGANNNSGSSNRYNFVLTDGSTISVSINPPQASVMYTIKAAGQNYIAAKNNANDLNLFMEEIIGV